jgi:hypothetical protein
MFRKLCTVISMGYFLLAVFLSLVTNFNEFFESMYSGYLVAAALITLFYSIHVVCMYRKLNLKDYLKEYFKWSKYLWILFLMFGVVMFIDNLFGGIWAYFGIGIIMSSIFLFSIDLIGIYLIKQNN